MIAIMTLKSPAAILTTWNLCVNYRVNNYNQCGHEHNWTSQRLMK